MIMTFSKRFGAILSPFVNNFKDAKNEIGRKAVVKNAVDAILMSRNGQEDAGDLPKDLQTVALFFMFSHI